MLKGKQELTLDINIWNHRFLRNDSNFRPQIRNKWFLSFSVVCTHGLLLLFYTWNMRLLQKYSALNWFAAWSIFMIKLFIVMDKKGSESCFPKWKIVMMACTSFSYASIYIFITSNIFLLQMSRVKIYVIFIIICQITGANKKLNSTPPYVKIITSKLQCLKT